MSDTSGTSETDPTANQGETVTDPPAESSGSSGSLSKGRLAAIAGGAAAIGLVLGLLIGWFSFDNGGDGGGRHNDRGRMSQQQGPGRGHQDGGPMGDDQFGGPMGPGRNGGQMMPGSGGQQIQPGQGNQVVPSLPSIPANPTTPSTQGTVVPQSLQQG